MKIVCYPKVCLEEYKTTVPCSLYAGFTMVIMILGSYYFDFVPALGKGMWTVAIVIHAVHILLFTYRDDGPGCEKERITPDSAKEQPAAHGAPGCLPIRFSD